MAQLQRDMADFKREEAESRTKFEDKLDEQFETHEANLDSRYRWNLFYQFLFALLAAVVTFVMAKLLPFLDNRTFPMSHSTPNETRTKRILVPLSDYSKPSINNNDSPPIDYVKLREELSKFHPEILFADPK